MQYNLFRILLLTGFALYYWPVPGRADGPKIPQGLQFGDLSAGRVTVWGRADRPAQMMVKYAFRPGSKQSTTVAGPIALAENDFTTRLQLTGLPPGRDVDVKVWYRDTRHKTVKGPEVTGSFHTPAEQDDIRFLWGGDTAGQGWGINEAFGGMKIYEAMRLRKPLFFIQNGDSIYADSPIPERKEAENGKVWMNLVTPEVSKVAETLAEFRGRYKYNLLDANLRRFNAEVPQIWQWDDHEVLNNWSSSKDLKADGRYGDVSLPGLLSVAGKAFREFAPLPTDHGHIYRKLTYGRLLDLFVLDMRSYRGPNSANLQELQTAETAFLGKRQLAWLQAGLYASRAVWKVIAADMPLGLNIRDDADAQGGPRWEGVANGDDGPARGRELEIAGLLRFIKQQRVRNVIWLTGDVHYAAAYYYDPGKARMVDFSPFWEFVAGPLNAGSFGPNSLDATFGPRPVFTKTPPVGQTNLSPYAGLQFFGEVNIDAVSGSLSVDLKDISGRTVFRKILAADSGASVSD